MSRWLVMRRTALGLWEDCHDPEEPIEALRPDLAQAAAAGDAVGIFRVIELHRPLAESIGYVTVDRSVIRRVVVDGAARDVLAQPLRESGNA